MEHRLAHICLSQIKREFEVYYTSFYSRKACPPLCLGFCGALVVAYLLDATV